MTPSDALRGAARHRWMRGCLLAALAAILLATAASALAALGWPFELFAHFRWQLLVATALVLPLSLPWTSRRMALVALGALALQCATLFASAGALPPTVLGCGPDTFRIASINLWYRGTDSDRVVAWLRANPADVVVLQELTPQWEQALDELRADYPQRLMAARNDPYGIGVLSRVPLEQARLTDFAGDGMPSIVAVANAGGRRVQVIGLHTRWPVTPALQRSRDDALHAAALAARASALPTVLAGDLNLTPYAPLFPRLIAESGLRDAFADRRWRPTWQAGFWPLALPLDHVLMPSDACVIATRIGADVGSDHRPVHVIWRWPMRQST